MGEQKLTKKDVQPALRHINDGWHRLMRTAPKSSSTLIDVPNPYIVPSVGKKGFVFEEQYYWDSYFTSLGITSQKMIEGMLDNLLDLFKRFRVIPNANRYYFTSRSQPPIITTFIFSVYERFDKSDAWLRDKISVALDEYSSVWMSDKHPHDRKVFEGLSRYYDINCLHDLAEAESGWDMTPRFQRQCLDYLPIDLNCLLYKYEMDFARAHDIFGETATARLWREAAEKRRKTVTKYLWSNRNGFFFDYNYQEKSQGKVWSLAAYYALWSGLATDDQAKKLIKRLERFNKKGGLTTTIGNVMYYSIFGSAKTQWAYPNGWAPLHYIVTEGLERYGAHAEAERIARVWLTTGNRWFKKHQQFLEKYNVVSPDELPADGLYPSLSGFGWTNAVFVYYAEKYLT